MNDKKNDSKLLYLQARYQFDQAMEKFENGQIKSEPQLIQNVFQSFQAFFTEMGKPHMIPRYAEEDGPPWSEDYNNMMKEIKADLEILFQEVDILGRSLYSHFNYNVMQDDIINTEYEETLDKLKDLEMYAGYAHDGMIRFGRDDFYNGFKIDYDRITGIPLEITSTGVSLPLSNEATNVAESAKVTIVPGNQKHNDYILGSDSNGFPGNNSEISMVSDDLLTGTTGYQFIGKDDNHGNYGTIIDGDPNTWFEYERINLREHEKNKLTKNLGWDYVVHGNKTLQFAEDPDNGVLRLHLQIVLDKEEIINQINLNMYVPPNYGSHPAIVKNILVSNDDEAPRSILPSNKQETDYSFRFDPIKAKVISILLEQEHKYFTDLGHIFYEQKMNVDRQTDYVFETVAHRAKAEYAPRLDGPKINLESLGVQVDVNETNVETIYPLKGQDAAGYAIEDIVDDLISQVDENTIEAGVERFEGWRYCIGIRDIEILSCEYLDRGELVTKPYYFDKPVDRIAISAQETIGSLLAENSMVKYEWIKYYVSIDDGKEWWPITPLEHELLPNNPPKLYTVQYVTDSEEAIDDREGYIETSSEIYSMRLRIVIERPEDNDTTGPQAFSLVSNKSEIPNRYASSSLQRFSLQVQTRSVDEDTDISTYTVDHKESGYESLPPVVPPDHIPDDSIPDHEEPDDNIGIPPGGINENQDEPILINLNKQPQKICLNKSFQLSGTVTSSLPITSFNLIINEEKVDIDRLNTFTLQVLAEPTKDNSCVDCLGTSSNDVIMPLLQTTTQQEFNWTIPYSLLSDLGIEIGDTVTIEIHAEDEKSKDSVYLSVRVEDCPDSPTCYEFLSIIIQYYNEDVNEIRELEVAKDILPFQFDNGEGVMVTVGWNKEYDGIVTMITDGYHEGNNAFIIHALGVRYVDYDEEDKVIWAEQIITQTNGVHHSESMLGNPEMKDANWISDVEKGDYEFAPSLNEINDYIVVSVDQNFHQNYCPFDSDFDPDENIQPEHPNNNKEEVFECHQIRKIFVQYYDKDKKQLRIKTVDLDEAYKERYHFHMNDNTITALIGWYEEYGGVAINLLSNNEEKLHISSVGILIRNKQDVLETIWSTGVVKQTNYVDGAKSKGPKKQISDIDWIDKDGKVIENKAPHVYLKNTAIIYGFDSKIINELCTVENIVDNLPDKPKFDLVPPVIDLDPISDPFYYHRLVDQLLQIKGVISDNIELDYWNIKYEDTIIEEYLGPNETIDYLQERIKINIPDPIEEDIIKNKKVDILFIVDTSGSMSNIIQNVKDNMQNFVDSLLDSKLDIRLGYLGSRYKDDGQQLRVGMDSPESFDLSDLGLNGGLWETYNWRQLIDKEYGAASLNNQLRSDAMKHVVLVTDTYIDEPLSDSILNEIMDYNYIVSVIWRKSTNNEPDYTFLANSTNGLSLDVDNEDFYKEMQDLASQIIESTTYIPDSTQIIVVEARDKAGNITRKEIPINFTDYNNPNRNEG